MPGVFQKQKTRPHSSHLYRSWTCRNQLPYKNKTQTNWKRTSDPRFRLVIAVTFNHWLEPLICPKVWMWSHPSFSSYCSYSHRLCKLDNIVFAMLDPINDLWKQLSTLVGANITATGLSYCHLYCTRSFFFGQNMSLLQCLLEPTKISAVSFSQTLILSFM